MSKTQFYSDNRNVTIKSIVICPMDNVGEQYRTYAIKQLNPPNIRAAVGLAKECFVQMELQCPRVAILSIEFEQSKS